MYLGSQVDIYTRMQFDCLGTILYLKWGGERTNLSLEEWK